MKRLDRSIGWWLRVALLGLMLGAVGPLPGAADPPPAEVAPAAGKNEPAAAADRVWETSHSIVVGGRRLDYRATAGWLPVSLDEGKSRARVFFVAYRLDAVEAAARPLTFAFNGGPGAASLWLHLGLLGPRRLVFNDDGTAPPPPARLEPNPDTWLAFTDLVLVDPVGTGFSRTEPDDTKTRREFYEVKKDIASMADFIRLYLTRYQRWDSPKLVVGESYGATRAAGLGEFLLDRYGIDLNGLLLISPVLDFSTIVFRSGNDLPYALYLPSYAAAARFHGRLDPEVSEQPLAEWLRSVEVFAETDYLSGLFRGDRLTRSERAELRRRLGAQTGLAEELIERSNLRIEPDVFRKELLRDQRLLTGRMDAGLTGADPNPATSSAVYDPAFDAVTGVFSGAMNLYLRRDLQVSSELNYEFLSEEANRNWDWAASLSRGQGFVEVSAALRNLLAVNRHLKVFVAAGLYDLATPYAATRYALDHLDLDHAGRRRLELHLYPAGHMMYTHRKVGATLTADAAAFYRQALGPSPAPPAPKPADTT